MRSREVDGWDWARVRDLTATVGGVCMGNDKNGKLFLKRLCNQET